jgi:hypothetical protein
VLKKINAQDLGIDQSTLTPFAPFSTDYSTNNTYVMRHGQDYFWYEDDVDIKNWVSQGNVTLPTFETWTTPDGMFGVV